MVTIQMGHGNCIRRPITHTSEISRDMIEGLGGNYENIELTLGGTAYAGPLEDGVPIECRQKTNGKG